MDGIFRTHIGMSGNQITIDLLYTRVETGPVKALPHTVYEHNGSELAEASPTTVKEEILVAMAARDNAGTF